MSEQSQTPEPKSPPRTPENLTKIPKDDSFKTCKTNMDEARARRQLRMTPARISILNGQKIFKESNNSGKKFNSKARNSNATSASKKKNQNPNDSAGSNETFIRCEQEIMFDRDSLEPENITKKRPHIMSKKPDSIAKKPIEPVFQKPEVFTKKPVPIARKPMARSTTKLLENSKWNNTSRLDTSKWTNFKWSTPSTWNSSKMNSSRLARSASYKSTAELERDYIRSLRS